MIPTMQNSPYPISSTGHLHLQSLPPQATQRPSLFFTLVLAFSFCAPGFSVIARQILGTYAFLGINLAGQLSLLLVLISRSSKPVEIRKGLLYGSGLVCLIAIFSAIAISETSGFSQIQKITVFGKSASICSLFIIYRLTAHLFYEKELLRGLFIFGLAEVSTQIFCFFILNLDLNANSVGLRFSTCSLVLYCLLPKSLRLLPLVISFPLLFALQCRTALLALLITIFIGILEKQSRFKREAYLIMAAFGFFVITIFLTGITGQLQQSAIKNLDNNNRLVQFFLSDKNEKKLKYDMLDRREVWNSSLERIRERPFSGYGIGSESILFGAR
ncbi:O-antigen ligase family protein, partial [bacterium]|nr:O-antigen ligase family protein [bacterium]